ncbi:MAG: NCS2 family permease [Verrucomicrobia bacterium]|nr:NCS2 family permease [Verrucomicrobiota bacterium]
MRAKWFVRGDIDGFFGLFIDNLLQLMLIVVLGRTVCGFPNELIIGRILPGAAISILLGNLYYGWQARKLAERTGREDVTALPYGINTLSIFAFVFFIIAPIYRETGDATLAWHAGLFACFISGILETAGAFAGDWIRRHTPRAALLSALAGIAIAFISMNFFFQIFASPQIALFPLILILVGYASGIRLPLRVPAGLLALIIGGALAWLFNAFGLHYFEPDPTPYNFEVYLFNPAISELTGFILSSEGWKYLSVIVPMGIFNVIGSLQNLESAEAAGDSYETKPSLLVNGLGSICAACFGSAFPTTIYIGHPGWKALGARSGYSVLNGLVITGLCAIGGITLILKVIPIEVVAGILVWIGIIMTAQAFRGTPSRHAAAVAVGIIPALAAWALTVVQTSLTKAGTNLLETADKFGSDLFIYGIIALNQGFILTSMIFAAILVYVIDRRFLKAGIWAFAASVFSLTGLIHAYEITSNGVTNKFGVAAAPGFAFAYLLSALFLLFLHFHEKRWNKPAESGVER